MKNLIRDTISRPVFQPLWSQLLKLCHAGMNCGGGQSVEASGEIPALDFVLRTADPSHPFVLFDVGANDGGYLQMALSRTKRDIRVHSFEPQASSVNALRSRFATDPRIHIHHTALGSEVGSVELFIGQGESVSSLHLSETSATGISETVHITTVDLVCAQEKIEHIDFLKIDTEGHEMDVLFGASVALSSDRIFAIQVEFGDTFLPTRFHFIDIYDLLAPKYRVYRILRKGLYEIDRYTHDLEIYKLTNYLFIRR